ncbi:MAG: c-type cytochrome [Planctomyces sp.]|nr:c-type cytochrome [Planctomyces sp.]
MTRLGGFGGFACAVWLATLAAAPAAEETVAPAAGPVDPEEAVTRFQLDDDLVIELVAAEPDVIDPVCIAFDPQGRMWVIEMRDYPLGPAEGQPGRSRIRVLSDSDGYGRFSDPQTFAEDLTFPNSLMFWRDGVLATTDGRIDFFADRDGDGRAEVRETWFAGFARENPQLRCNSPTLGLDGWIYVANGLRGGVVAAEREGWAPHDPVTLGGRDFRFDPATGAAETTSGFGQYGMAFDDFGRRFLCSNRNPCMHAVVPESALRRNADVTASAVVHDVARAGDESRIHPISRFWTTSNLHAGQFTAACGLRLERGSALPDGFRGDLFVCDPTGNLVHRERMHPAGATFESHSPHDGREFLATEDLWFRPVNLTFGPDGALYVVDMHRAVIEHPEYMPEELRTRPDLTLGSDRGRIYRIRPRAAANARAAAPVFDDAPPTDLLVERLAHPWGWQRETAFRLLFERQDPASVQPLRQLLNSEGHPAAKAAALWLLEAQGTLTIDDLRVAAGDASEDVVEQCLALVERRLASAPDDASLLEGIAERPLTTRLRFQLALALGAAPPASRRTRTLGSLLAADGSDAWLATAVALAAQRDVADVFLDVLSRLSGNGPEAQLAAGVGLGRLAEVIGGRNQPDELAALLRAIDSVRPASRRDRLAWVSQLWLRAADGLRARGHAPAGALGAAAAAAGVSLADELELACEAIQDSDAEPDLRLASIRLLEFSNDATAAPVLTAAMSCPDPGLASAAAQTLARRFDPDVAAALLTDFETRTPSLRRTILTLVASRADRAGALLDEIDAGRVAVADLDAAVLQQLQRIADPALQPRIALVAEAARPEDRSEVLARYRPAPDAPADPSRGRDLFVRHCAQCHRIGELGVNVAPDISDSRVKRQDQLLTDILDPNRAIDSNYFSYTVVDRQGVIHTGVIAAETATSLTLRQPEGREITLASDNIELIRSNGVSLMPAGFERELSIQDLADVISFVKNWRYLDGSVPPEVIR